MKSVLLSVRPEWVAKILNGEKTIEIRKKFPKDYVGWVYIYVTKGTNQLVRCQEKVWGYYKHTKGALKSYFNGKVVARFWCDRVEEITPSTTDNFTKDSCLTIQELENYLWSNILCGYAIHVTDVQPFDEPKEIKEFRRYCDKHFNWWTNKCLGCKAYTPDTDIEDYCNKNKLALTRAPESWCYVEI